MKINKEFISRQNTYPGKNDPHYIVIHETDNWNEGAGARRHASAQAAGHLSTSVHYYCGSDGVYQAAEHKDGTYSVGREYDKCHKLKNADNRNTLTIEICVNADGDYHTARENAIRLTKHLMQETGIPADRVIRHFDAKGKYCPRRMLDDPALWEDLKAQLGQTVACPSCPLQETDVWYRVGSGWENGVCLRQTGAYHHLEFAIADCTYGQHVYDEGGNVVYTPKQPAPATQKPQAAPPSPDSQPDGSSSPARQPASYTQRQFIRDVQAATGSVIDGYAGDETIKNTITVSRNRNRNHPVVTCLERRLKALGYYSGAIEADLGKTPNFGPGMDAAVRAYQRDHACISDGELTKGKKTWKSLLGML